MKPNPEVTIEIIRFLQLDTPDGVKNFYLSAEEADRYTLDPIAWAAEQFGLTADQYVEWLDLEGRALCGARRKDGHPCNVTVAYPFSAERWKEIHRHKICRVHRR